MLESKYDMRAKQIWWKFVEWQRCYCCLLAVVLMMMTRPEDWKWEFRGKNCENSALEAKTAASGSTGTRFALWKCCRIHFFNASSSSREIGLAIFRQQNYSTETEWIENNNKRKQIKFSMYYTNNRKVKTRRAKNKQTNKRIRLSSSSNRFWIRQYFKIKSTKKQIGVSRDAVVAVVIVSTNEQTHNSSSLDVLEICWKLCASAKEARIS